MWDALFDQFLDTMRLHTWTRRIVFASLCALLLALHAGWIWVALVAAAALICEFDVWLVHARKSRD